MRHFLIAAAITAASVIVPALAADADVSIAIGQPGFYGRLDIGGYPRPQVIYREPRIVEHVVYVHEPIYLRVPPGHRRHWAKHCEKYNACGERVYFVGSGWYKREYMPRYNDRHRARQNDRHDGRHGDDHGNDHGDGRHQ